MIPTDCFALRALAILEYYTYIMIPTDCFALRALTILEYYTYIMILTDCFALRALAILQNIRISWDYRPTFMLIFWRVPNSYTRI